mmetsp:Transcript_23998/g.66683  ORF Transcript_23998/g.66683 Transcript_23998/m.66683 type:complete len:204 (-) Transcript_23998:456-1067(-)
MSWPGRPSLPRSAAPGRPTAGAQRQTEWRRLRPRRRPPPQPRLQPPWPPTPAPPAPHLPPPQSRDPQMEAGCSRRQHSRLPLHPQPPQSHRRPPPPAGYPPQALVRPAAPQRRPPHPPPEAPRPQLSQLAWLAWQTWPRQPSALQTQRPPAATWLTPRWRCSTGSRGTAPCGQARPAAASGSECEGACASSPPCRPLACSRLP